MDVESCSMMKNIFHNKIYGEMKSSRSVVRSGEFEKTSNIYLIYLICIWILFWLRSWKCRKLPTIPSQKQLLFVIIIHSLVYMLCWNTSNEKSIAISSFSISLSKTYLSNFIKILKSYFYKIHCFILIKIVSQFENW